MVYSVEKRVKLCNYLFIIVLIFVFSAETIRYSLFKILKHTIMVLRSILKWRENVNASYLLTQLYLFNKCLTTFSWFQTTSQFSHNTTSPTRHQVPHHSALRSTHPPSRRTTSNWPPSRRRRWSRRHGRSTKRCRWPPSIHWPPPPGSNRHHHHRPKRSRTAVWPMRVRSAPSTTSSARKNSSPAWAPPISHRRRRSNNV